MAGIYKVWCNVEQKFVSGYFDTLPSTCPNNTTRYRCQQRLSDPSGNKLGCRQYNIATVSPASYAGDVQGRDLVAEETVLFDIKPGNGISMIRCRKRSFRHRRERIESAWNSK
jgi:hypothetical protein